MPSRDAFERVSARPDPDASAGRSGRRMARACGAPGPARVAVDGRPARRSAKDALTGRLHPVTAWAAGHRPTPGRRPVPGGGREIATAPDLLAAPDPAGGVATPDAAGGRKATAEQIRDYVVCVGGNRGGLDDAAAGVLDRAAEADFAGCDAASEVGAGRRREEGRCGTVVRGPGGLPPGRGDPGAGALACRERRAEGRQSGRAARYGITSLRVGAAELAGGIRNHRGLGDGPRGVPDVAVREDDGPTRAGPAAANLGLLGGGGVAAEASGHRGQHQDQAQEGGVG